MRIGLVLGAGGVLGGVWLVGGWHALATETGRDPGSAVCVGGTSAGALIAGLSASGVPPWFMLAHSAGETREVDDIRELVPGEASRSAGAVFRLHAGVPTLGPGSWRLALASLARPVPGRIYIESGRARWQGARSRDLPEPHLLAPRTAASNAR